jgi:hypothetical protein
VPRNTREWAKRELDAANNNLDWAMRHLLSVASVYVEPHPEIGKPAEQLAESLVIMQETINQLRGSF